MEKLELNHFECLPTSKYALLTELVSKDYFEEVGRFYIITTWWL